MATSGNQTLVRTGEILQQQQMDVSCVRNNQEGVVISDIVDRVGVKVQSSETITKVSLDLRKVKIKYVMGSLSRSTRKEKM